MRGRQGKLSKDQFGFVVGRSTIDAIERVKAITMGHIGKGMQVMAVSLDIRNAFNSLEWTEIRAMEKKRFPIYLRKIIANYLNDRSIVWIGKDAVKHNRKVERGVPQGSVLVPLLWDIAYDGILRLSMPKRCEVVCYADDTLIVTSGRDEEEMFDRANIAVELVTRNAKRLGLEVAIGKTEAIIFRRKSAKRLRGRSIDIKDERITIKYSFRYLGLLIRDDWSFREHFDSVAIKAGWTITKLNRLMANKRGPLERKRRLYRDMINSILLYGAPIWADEIREFPRLGAKIQSVQRKTAIRVVRA